MAVQLQRQIDLLLQRLHQAFGEVRREQSGHVLDADAVGAQLLEFVRDFHVVVQGVDGADGVHHRPLEVLARGLDGFGRHADVARVVEGIEHAEDVHPGVGRRFDECADDLVPIVTVPDEVLAAQQHLKRSAPAVVLDGAQTLPGVFVKESQAGIEGGAAPDLERMEAHLVHGPKDRDDVAYPHSRCPQRLMAIAKGGVGDSYASSLHQRGPSVSREVGGEPRD